MSEGEREAQRHSVTYGNTNVPDTANPLGFLRTHAGRDHFSCQLGRVILCYLQPSWRVSLPTLCDSSLALELDREGGYMGREVAIRFLRSGSRGTCHRGGAESPPGRYSAPGGGARDTRSADEGQPLRAAGQRVSRIENAAADGPGGSEDPHLEFESAEVGRRRHIRSERRERDEVEGWVCGVLAWLRVESLSTEIFFFLIQCLGPELSGTAPPKRQRGFTCTRDSKPPEDGVPILTCSPSGV